MATGKRLTSLEMPDDEPHDTKTVREVEGQYPLSPEQKFRKTPQSIPLPPIPPAPRREIMVQLSIKAPLALVERLEAMTKTTGSQKQAVMAAALDAYLRGHGY